MKLADMSSKERQEKVGAAVSELLRFLARQPKSEAADRAATELLEIYFKMEHELDLANKEIGRLKLEISSLQMVMRDIEAENKELRA